MPAGAAIASLPGSHSVRTGPFSMLITASRTMDAVPGISSAAFTHFVPLYSDWQRQLDGVFDGARSQGMFGVHRNLEVGWSQLPLRVECYGWEIGRRVALACRRKPRLRSYRRLARLSGGRPAPGGSWDRLARAACGRR